MGLMFAFSHAFGRVLSVHVLLMKCRSVVFAIGPRFIIISFVIMSVPGAFLVFNFFSALVISWLVNSVSNSSMFALAALCCVFVMFWIVLSRGFLWLVLLTLV